MSTASAIVDAHHHIWRQMDLPWLMGPMQPRIFGPYEAIVPEVAGTAHITGRHEFLIDPDDPMGEGFLLR